MANDHVETTMANLAPRQIEIVHGEAGQLIASLHSQLAALKNEFGGKKTPAYRMAAAGLFTQVADFNALRRDAQRVLLSRTRRRGR